MILGIFGIEPVACRLFYTGDQRPRARNELTRKPRTRKKPYAMRATTRFVLEEDVVMKGALLPATTTATTAL
jgi:hypothetical protein